MKKILFCPLAETADALEKIGLQFQGNRYYIG